MLVRQGLPLSPVTCAQCGIRKAVAACGLCLLCLGATTAAGPVSAAAAASTHKPVITAVTADRADEPHTPELPETRLVGPEMENPERHPLTLDHPHYGVVGGPVYLAYCDTCPLANRDDLPLCVCPRYGLPPASFIDALARARPSNYRQAAVSSLG
jgi:hypothetical protein